MAKIIGQSCGAVDADDLDACGRCFTCRRSRQIQDEQPDPAASVFGPVQRWGKLPQKPDATTCNSTPDGPACDWDPSCPTHGILGG